MIFSIAEIKPVKIQQILSVLKPDWNCYSSHRILQLSANIKMKNRKIKTNFVSPEGAYVSMFT